MDGRGIAKGQALQDGDADGRSQVADQREHRGAIVVGDLISVPAGTKHWFDMGIDPEFTAIRLFTNSEGWVAEFTGDMIAQRFPKLDD